MTGRLFIGNDEVANVKSIAFTEAVNAGVDLRPGCVSSAMIEVEVFGDQSAAVESGAEVSYYHVNNIGVQSLVGYFYTEPIVASKNSYRFVAYDAVSKLDADFSDWLSNHQSDFPMTIFELVSAACNVAGVTLGSPSWGLSDQQIGAFYLGGITCRDVLAYAAEIGCQFVRADVNGDIVFDWYVNNADERIYPSSGETEDEVRYAYKQDGLSYANYETAQLDCVVVQPIAAVSNIYVYPEGESGNAIYITNNPLLQNGEICAAAAYAIYNGVYAVGTYRPMTAELFPKESPFRAGQIVAVTDIQGVSFQTAIMKVRVDDSAATLTSTGNEVYADSTDTARALNQLAQTVQDLSEDTAAEFEAVRTQTAASIQTMQEQITSTVKTTYLSKEAFDVAINGDDEVEGILAQISTSIQQTADGIRYDFESFADNTSGAFDTIYSYIQMSGGTITLGKADSDIQLKIDNDRIEILVAGEAVTYWTSEAFISPKSLEIPEGGRLVLGNYAYVPRSNGSLDFVWVGDDS